MMFVGPVCRVCKKPLTQCTCKQKTQLLKNKPTSARFFNSDDWWLWTALAFLLAVLIVLVTLIILGLAGVCSVRQWFGFSCGGGGANFSPSTYDALVLSRSPVVYLKMDDPESSLFATNSANNIASKGWQFGYGHNILCTAAPALGSGDEEILDDETAWFNAADQCIGVTEDSDTTMVQPPTAVLNYPTTIEAWINTNSTGTIAALSRAYMCSSPPDCANPSGMNEKFISLYVTDGGVTFNVNNAFPLTTTSSWGPGLGPTITATQSVSNTLDHHIVAAFDPSNGMFLYVDGNLAAAYSAAIPSLGDASSLWSNWQFGWVYCDITYPQQTADSGTYSSCAAPETESYSGFMGRVAIYQTIGAVSGWLSQADVLDDYLAAGGTYAPYAATLSPGVYDQTVLSDSPAFYWPGTDTNPNATGLIDTQGSYPASLLPSAKNFSLGGAVTVLTTGATIASPKWASLSRTGAFELWAIASTAPKLVSFGPLFMGATANGSVIVGVGSSINATAGRLPNDGNWHQLVMTFGGPGLWVWLDGALTVGLQPYSLPSPLVSGSYSWVLAAPANTQIKRVSAYNATLDHTRIIAHWAAGQ